MVGSPWSQSSGTKTVYDGKEMITDEGQVLEKGCKAIKS